MVILDDYDREQEEIFWSCLGEGFHRRSINQAIPYIQKHFPGICPHCDCTLDQIDINPPEAFEHAYLFQVFTKEGDLIYSCHVIAGGPFHARNLGWRYALLAARGLL